MNNNNLNQPKKENTMKHLTQCWRPGTKGVVVMNEDAEEGPQVVKVAIRSPRSLHEGIPDPRGRDSEKMQCSKEFLAKLCEHIADDNDLTVDDMIAQDRSIDKVRARHRFMAEASDVGFSLSRIGRFLGRHHSSILHGVRKHRERVEYYGNNYFV